MCTRDGRPLRISGKLVFATGTGRLHREIFRCGEGLANRNHRLHGLDLTRVKGGLYINAEIMRDSSLHSRCTHTDAPAAISAFPNNIKPTDRSAPTAHLGSEEVPTVIRIGPAPGLWATFLALPVRGRQGGAL